MKRSPLALAIAMVPVAVFAGQDLSRKEALKLSDSLITANRMVEQRSESSAASTVFTREDIDRLQPVDVPELLARVPGMQVTRSGGRGSATGVFLRGTKTAQTLVLIDGVRVGSAAVGGAALQYLSIDQIERVEVLRGSRSAIHGADAMGGVIQIFTRRATADGWQPRVRLAAGNKGTFERTLGLSGGNAQTRFSLAAALEETSGIDRTHKSFATDKDHDAYRNRSFSFNLSHQFTDALAAGVSVLDQRGKTEIDNPYGAWNGTDSVGAKPYDEFALSTSTLWLEGRFNELWSSRIELGHSEDKQENLDKLFPGSSVNNSYRDSVNWLNTLDLGNGHGLLLGLDYLNDKVRTTNAFAVKNRYNKAGFAQYSFKGETLGAELGWRHDSNQQYGNENTFNSALSYQLNSDNQVLLSYAEGIRVPTFADLYWPLSPYGGYQGNPNLKPEKSRSYELQWRSQLGATTQLEASIYRADYRNLIATFVTDPNPLTYASTTKNIDRARVNGFEASLKQELYGWQSELGVSVIDPRDRKSGHTLQNRARRTLSFDLDRHFGSIGVGAGFQAVSSSYADPANKLTLPGYGLLDLRASWQASDELGFDLKLSNVLDKSYSRNMYNYGGRDYGYREMRSSIMLGLTWTPSL